MYEAPSTIYVGEFQFPEGCAAALRVLGMGKALREAGHRMLFAGIEKKPRPQDRQPDGSFRYQGFPYFTREYSGQGSLDRCKWFFQAHVGGNTTFERLNVLDLSAVKAIIAYHPSVTFLYRLMKFCRRRNIALINDITEWHHPRHLPGKQLSPFYCSQEYRNRRLMPKVGNVIAISSYLEKYFLSRNCLTIRVPTLLDVAHAEPLPASEESRSDSDELRLVFTGSNLREKWEVIFDAMLQLKQAGRRVRLDVYGLARESFFHYLAPKARRLADRLGDALIIHGRVPREQYLRGVAEADFLVMLRDIEPWSQACFPTKFPEMMLQGLPLISNAHSDIGEYVRDGQEMLLVESPSVADLTRTLERAMNLPRAEISRMKAQARQRVADCFDYHHYVGPLSDFIEKAVHKAGSKT
ncbi:MAG: glycosyltransferase family 4 protein [Thermoguttaceae bacterium]|jgi:glycosyltransferase involved in cell wall biosynthesis